MKRGIIATGGVIVGVLLVVGAYAVGTQTGEPAAATTTTTTATTTTQPATTTIQPATTTTTARYTEQDYLTHLRDISAEFTYLTWVDLETDATLTSWGRTTCDLLDSFDVPTVLELSAAALEDLYPGAMEEGDYYLIGAAMRAAGEAWCPWHTAEMDRWSE